MPLSSFKNCRERQSKLARSDCAHSLISSGDCRPLRAPALSPLALTVTPPEPSVYPALLAFGEMVGGVVFRGQLLGPRLATPPFVLADWYWDS